MKKLVNITDITAYLYCPRKIYLRIVKGMSYPPNEKMIIGRLRHEVFDIFNKNEEILVSGIKSNLPENEIGKLYETLLDNIIKETLVLNNYLIRKFAINEEDFSKSVKQSAHPEISLRTLAVKNTLNLGFLGQDLWKNLKPKYHTELKLESSELGLKGRIDRVKIEDEILPYEVKTRDKVYDSDKIQLAGYALLLESRFNKPVNRGIIEFLGKQENIILDEKLKSQVLDIAEKIRNLTEETAFTPSSFSKCNNCEFKKDCDESL
jgi:CRISPR-associated protein Cas4